MANVNIKGHQQDDSRSCGRACAQMLIGFEWQQYAVASGTVLLSQGAMAAAEAGTAQGWETEPAELAAHVNSGLTGIASGTTWAMVEFRPSQGSADPDQEVADNLLAVVRANLDQGIPSAIMIDDNDHWEVVRGYDSDAIMTKDPLPNLGAATNHHDGDLCEGLDDTVRFINSTSARAVVCDAMPFIGSAIAIVRQVEVNPRMIPAGKLHHQPIDKVVRPPFPPLLSPMTSLLTFLQRDLWRFLRALGKIPEPASFFDFDWERAVVRHAAFARKAAPPIALIGVPPVAGGKRSVLLALGLDGTLDAFRVTSHHRLVTSLESAAPSLWIVREHGQSRWMPFEQADRSGGKARLRRVYDGEEIAVPDGDLQ